MYQALYRKYRPVTFDEVVGQKVIVQTLKNAILNNKINHAYLFTGPRGTGKTSIAKIFAKIVNCENLKDLKPCNNCVNCTQIIKNQNTDIVEIDAASNNGVDEIRELRDKVSLVPSYGKYKVYIIDEVHMLTTAAFNALLKTLEEPPKHIIFILATTEPHKIPSTILSRCQRFDFKKVDTTSIVDRLKYVCEQEKIIIEDSAINLIANLSDGGMRDALSLLDQVNAYAVDRITENDVHDVYGSVTKEEIYKFITLMYEKNLNEIFNLIDYYDNNGKNMVKIIENIVEFLKNTLIYFNSSEYFNEKSKKNMYENICKKVDERHIYDSIEILLDSIKTSKNTSNTKLMLELSVIRIIELDNKESNIQKIDTEDIKVYEDKKKITSNIKYESKQVTDEVKENINKFKKIRINNTLARFEKKEFISFKKDLDRIKDMLMNPDYSMAVSLILDGELKAKGDKNLIFVYKLKNLEELFNQSIIDIQKVFLETYNTEYRPIAVTKEEWEIIKEEFNKNMKSKSKKYEYIKEKSIEDVYNLNTSVKESKNAIEEIFEDVIVYN